MADNTTGVSQSTLNQVLLSGNANLDNQIFNTRNVNTPTLQPQINLPSLKLDKTNAPNTSPQNIQLTNQFLDVNRQNFNLQSQQVQNQADLQNQALIQSQKDAQTRNLMLFGQGGYVNPSQSSRNLSFTTDVNARVTQQLNNTQKQATLQLNQIASNYATQNLSALNMNRQNDFQDRQFNLSEALQRGSETGQQYIYNPNTGKVENTGQLNLQGKSFDASMTGSYTDYQGQKQRTLQARQIDSNLIDAGIKRALTVSDLTGYMPSNLSSAVNADGTPNFNFDFTQQSREMTTQGKLNQAAIAQAGYTQNLYGSMNASGVYNQEVAAKSALLDAQINQAQTSNIQQTLAQAQTKYAIDNPQTWQSVSPQATQNLLEAKLWGDKANAETDPIKQAEFFKFKAEAENKYFAEYGKGDSLYYTTDKELNDKNQVVKETFRYKTGALAKYGLDGSQQWTTNDPKKQTGIDEMTKSLTQEFLKSFEQNPEDPSKTVNKLIFTSPKDNTNMLLAFRSVVKGSDGQEIPAGYEYKSINITGLNQADRVAFNDALDKALVNDTNNKDVKVYNNSLQNANKIIADFAAKDTTGKLSKSIPPLEFVKQLEDYGLANTGVLNGITNAKAMGMLLLGSNTAGNDIVKDDANGSKFNSTLNSVQATLDNVQKWANANKKDPKTGKDIVIDPDTIFKSIYNGDKNIQMTSEFNSNLTMPMNESVDNAGIIKNMTKWSKNYKNKGLEQVASNNLGAILRLNNAEPGKTYDANGKPLSIEYLFSGNYLK